MIMTEISEFLQLVMRCLLTVNQVSLLNMLIHREPRPQLDKQTRFIITLMCLGLNASESVNKMLCSAAFLLQEGLYRKRSHLAARSQERNAAFTATTGSLSENAAEVHLNITFLLNSSFNNIHT